MLSTQSIIDHQKQALKAENEKVMTAIKSHFESVKDSTSAVLLLDERVLSPSVAASGNTSKVVSEAIKQIGSKMKDKSVYIIATDGPADETGSGKVVHGCHVSEGAKAKGADAGKWTSSVAEIVGGKAGGKGATSLGQGSKADQVDKALEVARSYLDGLTIS